MTENGSAPNNPVWKLVKKNESDAEGTWTLDYGTNQVVPQPVVAEPPVVEPVVVPNPIVLVVTEYVAPEYVAPEYVAPEYVAPEYVAPAAPQYVMHPMRNRFAFMKTVRQNNFIPLNR